MSEADPLPVTCVDPDGRLGPVVTALRTADDVAVAVVETVDDVSATAACCVLLHAPETVSHSAVDGFAQLDALTDAHPEMSVALYGHDIGSMTTTTRAFTHRAVDEGVDAAITMGGNRPELIVRRVKQAAGRETHFQSDSELLDSLLDSFPHQLFVKDDVGRFVETSAHTASEYDFDRDELVGLTDYELLPHDLADELYEEEQRIMAAGEPMLNKVEHYVDIEGRSRWVNTAKAPRFDADGDPIGIVGSTRDVTDEKRQEHMVRAVHEASRDLVRAGDRTEIGEVTVAIAKDIPALPRVQVALVDADGGTLRPVDPDDQRRVYDRYAEWYDRAFDRGETLFVTADGADAVAEWTAADEPAAALIPVGDHGVFGVTTGEGTVDEFTLDLANILAANVEAALDRAERERELERQNERLEEFASIVSHDLRNPLTVADAYAEIAREDPQPRHFDKIEGALDRMAQLTEELLTLAKKGQAVGETTAVRLQDAVDEARASVGADRLTVRTADCGTVEADASRLVELLENLFRNAVEHGSSHGRPASDDDAEHGTADDEAVTVTVGMLPDGEGFYVADDGPGIAESEREKVFEMGYTDSEDGTGYGLYIVKTIAEAHGWSVAVTESDAGGARFEVSDGTVR
ncbi:PAS domain-containing sensor histidine kinase [Halomicroarcula sp. S1AR25-4]|uniref:PAS domain-containing sensor histidine kinase n=1 Tax=Haloarcula sp. S1AR25-4 TaxID=2950538 RepID=UPI0028747CB1|nr:PAS domain-containing sensor histidine kinase [Halomicroarcula sp. S1AR25-4]MDS0278956.1 PAS domain-containing sensor histidine kinase [Halomicroarcula sp. S1AR25-4]